MNFFFLDGLCRAVKLNFLTVLILQVLSRASWGAFPATPVGFPRAANSSLIPFRSLRVSQQRGPLPRTSLCLEMYLHRASPSPAVPRCPLRGWGDLVLIFCGFSITLKYDCLQMFQPMCKLPVNSVLEMRKCCQQLDFHVSLHTHLHITTIKYDFQELFFSNLKKCLSNISAFFCVIFF